MQIICISRGTYSGGREFAHKLAEKLGYSCLSREELIQKATDQGIKVGKLEMAMVKPGIFSERLGIERDHYLAYSCAELCENALSGGMVYHGRTGHFLLPGVSHVLRIRVIADEEFRISKVMRELHLEREKALKYIREVDEDRRRWVHSMYSALWDDPSNYDVVINLAHMSMENAACAIMNMAQLPDFQMTPASKRAMEDLLLAAKVRVAIARDERTYMANVKIRANNGDVNVSYMPQDAKIADAIADVCKHLAGVKDIQVTMAMTNILWIQDQFHPETEVYQQVVEIATKWNAAVELVRLELNNGDLSDDKQLVSGAEKEMSFYEINKYNGGIEDDGIDDDGYDGGLKSTLDELSKIGKSGGGSVVHGTKGNIINALDKSMPYTLVVIGDLFKSHGHAISQRAMRDLRSFLSDRIKAPVVTSDELSSQFLFGKRDIPRVIFFLLVTLAIYVLVFTHQHFVMAFQANTGWFTDAIKNTFLAKVDWGSKILVSITIFILVPTVACLYGNVTGAILKLIKME